MQLTLLVPGLLLPPAIRPAILFDLAAPALALLLGRGERQPQPADWLPGAFGLTSPLPAASLRKVGAGETVDGDWLCLDPVQLRVAREGIALADPAGLELTADEAAALSATVAPLFADWGRLAASAPGRWELQLARPLALATRPLSDCIDRPVDVGLPGGTDGREWRRLIAEAQTLLHDHPVNRLRDSQGRPTANSLWPWGAGALPQKVATEFTAVLSDDPVVAGLCAQAGIPCQPPADRYAAASGRQLAIDTRLAAPARSLDAMRWREALLALEHDWLAPALAALKRGALAQLQLVGTGADLPAVAFTLTRGGLWRFWRRPRALTELG